MATQSAISENNDEAMGSAKFTGAFEICHKMYYEVCCILLYFLNLLLYHAIHCASL